jgi:hypothetical protein
MSPKAVVQLPKGICCGKYADTHPFKVEQILHRVVSEDTVELTHTTTNDQFLQQAAGHSTSVTK